MTRKVIGLTGNIGTGKSTVLAMLRALGADVIDADRVAHEVMRPGAAAYQGIVDAFGPDILAPDGAIDRIKLGARVFREAAALQRLEAIVHPAVFAAIQALLAASQAPVVVIEAIKLLEAGLSVTLCDTVWVVTATHEQQVERLMRTRGLSQPEAEMRIQAQPPQEEKVKRADRVIDNRGTLAETAAQVEAAWQALLAADQ